MIQDDAGCMKQLNLWIDTIDHTILLGRLKNFLGIKDTAVME